MEAGVPQLSELQQVASQNHTLRQKAIKRWINADYTFNEMRLFSMRISNMRESPLKAQLKEFFEKEEEFRYDKGRVDARNNQRERRNMPNYPRSGNIIPSYEQLQEASYGNKALQIDFFNNFIETKWSLTEFKLIKMRLAFLQESLFKSQMIALIKQEELYHREEISKIRQITLDEQKLQLESKKIKLDQKRVDLQEKKLLLQENKYKSDTMAKKRIDKLQCFKILVSLIGIFCILVMGVAAYTITAYSMKNPINYPVPSGGSLVKADSTTQQAQQTSKTVDGILWALCILFVLIGCIIFCYRLGCKCYVFQCKLFCCSDCCKQWYFPLPFLRKKTKDEEENDVI